jgi:hypothetical protein
MQKLAQTNETLLALNFGNENRQGDLVVNASTIADVVVGRFQTAHWAGIHTYVQGFH